MTTFVKANFIYSVAQLEKTQLWGKALYIKIKILPFTFIIQVS